jgi:transcriptional regulator of acetoin/glycerol metabolism
MKELTLTAEQTALVGDAAPTAVPPLADDESLMLMPLTEAKRLAAAEFERRYLLRVMERAGGSVSEGARMSGLDRTNFRRQLQRHGLR